MKLLAILFVTLFLVSGCKITSIEGESDDVEIKINSTDDGNGQNKPDGKFCPPGQAKKGRC